MPSFDTKLEADFVEVKNAVENTAKEIGTRFDFKGSAAKIESVESGKDRSLQLHADSDFQIAQVRDILTGKLTKRGVDIRFLDFSAKIEKMGGDKVRQTVVVKQGIDSDTAKKIQGIVKQSKLKVQAAIQGDSVRITGGKRDDLQAAIALLKKDVTDVPLAIALDMTVAGDRLTLDFSRSSPQCAGPVNISRATAVAACYVALKHLFPDVPANAGVLDAVDFVMPEGLVITAQRPRPVGGYTETILRMIDVIFSATALADPQRAVAHAYGTINALSIAGHRTDDKRKGQRWVMFSFFGGGHGGHSDGDGLSHGNAPISTATIPPMEILEAAYPVRFTQWALRPGSGGDGQHRGGLGAIYELELLEDSAEAFIFGERGKSAPKGIHGGQPALPNVFEYCQNGEWKTPPMVSKMLGIHLKKGDRVRLQTPGGGGWGSPAERSAQDRAKDSALGYTKEQA